MVPFPAAPATWWVSTRVVKERIVRPAQIHGLIRFVFSRQAMAITGRERETNGDFIINNFSIFQSGLLWFGGGFAG